MLLREQQRSQQNSLLRHGQEERELPASCVIVSTSAEPTAPCSEIVHRSLLASNSDDVSDIHPSLVLEREAQQDIARIEDQTGVDADACLHQPSHPSLHVESSTSNDPHDVFRVHACAPHLAHGTSEAVHPAPALVHHLAQGTAGIDDDLLARCTSSTTTFANVIRTTTTTAAAGTTTLQTEGLQPRMPTNDDDQLHHNGITDDHDDNARIDRKGPMRHAGVVSATPSWRK